MARQKSGRPRGRPSTVEAGAPTAAETSALEAITALTALGDPPTTAALAAHCGWSRQRASAVLKRLDAKGLLAKDAIRGRRAGPVDDTAVED